MNRRFGSWRRGLTAAATAVAGVTTVLGQLSGIVLTGPHANAGLSDLPLHLLGIGGGLGLLLLAAGLWHGKRRAAEVAIAALCLIGATRLAYGQSPLDAGIDLLPALFILANLRAFPRGVGAFGSRRLTDTLGLVAGAGLYAVYAVADIGARDGTELDRAVASAGSHLPAGHDRRRHGLASGPADQRRDRAGPGRSAGRSCARLLRPAAPEDGHSAERA